MATERQDAANGRTDLFSGTQEQSPANYDTYNAGSPWQYSVDRTTHDYDTYLAQGGRDQRSYMYGRDPNAANAAVGLAQQTGAQGQALGQQAVNFGQGVNQVGYEMLGTRTNDAINAYGRAAQQGEFGMQNQTLGQLGGLEATQGPSAAQAQLDAGTNQAMGSQLALARSGRGFGGNAAAMGQAQGNMAGIQANQANAAASLRAQEDAAWRARQASNLGQVAGMQGQQSQANLGAAVQSRGQNDAAAMGLLGMGQDAYFQGANAGMQGYGMGMQGVNSNLAGQGLGNQIRGQEMQGGQAQEDNALRYYAAKNNLSLGQQQQKQQETAGWIGAGAAGLGLLLSDMRAKKDIVRSDEPAISFARGTSPNVRSPDTEALDAVAAAPGYGYKYTDPSAPGARGGNNYGPMAQDLAATPAGSTAVVKGKDGQLGIDPARLQVLDHSAISAQQRQLDQVMAELAAFKSQPSAQYPIARQVPY